MTIFSFGIRLPDAKLEAMITAGRQSQSRISEAPAADLRLDPQWCDATATWRQRRRFQDAARALIRIPAPDADPLEQLLTEDLWRQLVPADDQEEVVLTALSQATGVYFFPTREWVAAFCRFIHLLEIRRVLEAGAGRGYLAAALAPLLARQGVAFKTVDKAQGEFESGLDRHPVVEQTDALTALQDFRPDLVLYAWPPPGQSIGPLCRCASVRYVLVLGEPGGGCTGDPTDWQRFGYHPASFLSRYGLGRSGRRQQAATVFFGSAHPLFRETPVLDAKMQGHPVPTEKIIKILENRLHMSRIPAIDEESCIGCNACVDVCPEVFVFNDTLGWAMVLFPDGAPEEKIQEAIDICPVHCIDWIE